MKTKMKKLVCMVLVLTAALCFYGCDKPGKTENIGQAGKSAEEDKYISMVKTGYPANYPDSPYGEVFDRYFENPGWTHFSAKNSENELVDIVEFTGDCEFKGADYRAQIQFTVDLKKYSFEATYLALDGEAQTMEALQELLMQAYKAEGPAVSGEIGVPATTAAAPAATTAAPVVTAPPVVNIVPPSTGSQYNYYILPYSSSSYLTWSDISYLSKDQLRYARNEIYARHGRMFNDKGLQNYFNAQQWYTPIYSPGQFKDSWLSKVERENIEFIKSYE